jgi:hypothetical protein
MKIECTLQRVGGTIVELGKTSYHFAPTPDDERHIAEVTNEAHIERFLVVRESFRILRTAGAAAVEETIAPVDNAGPSLILDAQLEAATGFPHFFTVAGKDYELPQIVRRAFDDSGLTVEDWNGLDNEHRATKIEIVLDALEDGEIELTPISIDDGRDPGSPEPIEPGQGLGTPPGTENYSADPGNSNALLNERAELDAQYKAKFGKLPPSNMKVETLKAKLAQSAE